MVEDTRLPKRKWQNLFYKKCPNCNERLEDRRLYFMCPTPNPEDVTKSCFFIKKEKASELLLDIEHPANFCLTERERATIEDVVKEF